MLWARRGRKGVWAAVMKRFDLKRIIYHYLSFDDGDMSNDMMNNGAF
jgi:hypothetical protein